LIYDIVRFSTDESKWKTVETGERARVMFHRFDDSTFLPNVIERDEATLILPTTVGCTPLIVRGEGCELIDADGCRYLDCYSDVGAMSLGHSHPDILAAAHAQIDQLQHTTTIYLTEAMFDLAERLAELAPGELNRSFFCASGTEANEAALLMTSQYTGRGQFLSLEGGLHGRTKSAMSVTQIPMWRTDPFLLESCHGVPGYNANNSLARIEHELSSRKYAAVIAEPIQGNGGIVTPPRGYWQRLRNICDDTGTLLIADEVQSGINQTGTFFAVDHEQVIPDFITTAKALGNGFPITACLTTDNVADVCTRPAASTYGPTPSPAAWLWPCWSVIKKSILRNRPSRKAEDWSPD